MSKTHNNHPALVSVMRGMRCIPENTGMHQLAFPVFPYDRIAGRSGLNNVR
jgi:hypothetical protein